MTWQNQPVLFGSASVILFSAWQLACCCQGGTGPAPCRVFSFPRGTNEQWSMPLNFVISQLFKIGGQPMQAFVGGRYYAEAPEGGPEWGLRAGLGPALP